MYPSNHDILKCIVELVVDNWAGDPIKLAHALQELSRKVDPNTFKNMVLGYSPKNRSSTVASMIPDTSLKLIRHGDPNSLADRDTFVFTYAPEGGYTEIDDYHYVVLGTTTASTHTSLLQCLSDFEEFLKGNIERARQIRDHYDYGEDQQPFQHQAGGGVLDIGYVWLVPGNQGDYEVHDCAPAIDGALCIGTHMVLDPDNVH